MPRSGKNKLFPTGRETTAAATGSDGKMIAGRLARANLVNGLVGGLLFLGVLLNAGSAIAGEAVLDKKAQQLAEEVALTAELKRQETQVLAEQHYQRGLKLQEENKSAEAAAEFQEALKIDPERRGAKNRPLQYRPPAEKGTGVTAGKKQAKARLKTPADIYLEAGISYLKQGDYSRAVEEFKKILPLSEPLSADHLRALILINLVEKAQALQGKNEAEEERKANKEQVLSEVSRTWLVPVKKMAETEEAAKGVLEQKIKFAEKARRPVSFSFENAHLRDVVMNLSKMSGVNIVLDETIFAESPAAVVGGTGAPTFTARKGTTEEAGKEGSTRIASPLVTMSLENIPLIEALDIILRSKGLRCRLEPNLFYVSTPEVLAGQEMITRIYHLRTGIAAVPEIQQRERAWGEEEYTQ